MSYNTALKRALKLLAVTACAGALVVGYAYYAVATSDAFGAFKYWCAHSQKLAAPVGHFQDAQLVFLGHSAFVKDKGETGSAAFRARIIGSNAAVDADVTMKRERDLWIVSEVLIEGKQMDLK